MMPLFDKWKNLLNTYGVTERPVISYTELLNRYGEPMRYYHTFHGHIVMAHGEFEQVRHLCPNPLVVELALFTHDAVYDTQSKINEEKSAEWLHKLCKRLGVPQEAYEAAGELIVDASKTHHGILNDVDRNIFISCDLAILGRPWEEYAAYIAGIGKEYAWVDEMFLRR